MLAAARFAFGTAMLLTPGLVFVASHAMAAGLADMAEQDGRSDRIRDQEDAIEAAQDLTQQLRALAAPFAPPEFNFRVVLPLYYNSNAKGMQSGGPAALEGDPAVELGWGRSLTSVPVKINLRLRADTDRYANVSQSDEDEVSGSFKVSYYDSQNDQAWAPFFSYRSSVNYDSTFSSWIETKNDLTLGVDKLFNFDNEFHLLPNSARSRISTVWSLGFSFYVQRRLRTPGPNSIALYLVPSATFVPSNGWILSLLVSTRERCFESVTTPFAMIPRHDFEIEPILTIAYDPKLPGAPQIALQASFERRSSNLPNKSWNQWTVGPVLSANWTF
jgi:hypothetical protein